MITPLNELQKYIQDNNIPESEVRTRLLDSYAMGGVGFKFAKMLLDEYTKPTEEYKEDISDEDLGDMNDSKI